MALCSSINNTVQDILLPTALLARRLGQRSKQTPATKRYCKLWLSALEMCMGVGMGMGTDPPKPACIQAGMGTSINLDPRSWRVWVRHFAVTGFSPIPAVELDVDRVELFRLTLRFFDDIFKGVVIYWFTSK